MDHFSTEDDIVIPIMTETDSLILDLRMWAEEHLTQGEDGEIDSTDSHFILRVFNGDEKAHDALEQIAKKHENDCSVLGVVRLNLRSYELNGEVDGIQRLAFWAGINTDELDSADEKDTALGAVSSCTDGHIALVLEKAHSLLAGKIDNRAGDDSSDLTPLPMTVVCTRGPGDSFTMVACAVTARTADHAAAVASVILGAGFRPRLVFAGHLNEIPFVYSEDTD